VLRVNLTTGTISKESMEKYKPFLGGTGLAWKVLWDEVPPGTTAFEEANKVIFSVGPATGSGSPCSGRTSVSSLWPVHGDELPSAGHMGGHWGPELKYAGYDAIIVEGQSAKPVWLRIEDDEVTLEDASAIWGQGIYRATNYIVNLMGSDAHVAAIGQAGENGSRLGAVFCDRSHRAGGVGGILGVKKLKAIGVRGTGAVKIAMNKKEWRDLNNYYLSLIGCNNQGVVAKTLQPWSEYSPGASGTRWSGAPGVKWGASMPPVDVGNCPDDEHPMIDAPYPLNKIGMRTQKGFNDFQEEGLKRTVRMDGCHACPIRCHIAADHPELENYGVSRYNMNTCAGNGGLRNTYIDDAVMNPQQGPMLLAYMSNHLEGDYGIWTDYQGTWYQWELLFNFTGTHSIVEDDYIPATVPNTRSDATPGSTIPNPLLAKDEEFYPDGQPLIRKYITAAEWTRIRTTILWSSGKSPLALMETGDPRWLQFFGADLAANKPGTIGWFFGRGPAWMAKLGAETEAARKPIMWTPTGLPAGVTATPVEIRKQLPPDYGMPELYHAWDVDGHVHTWKQGHALHHSIENQSQIGGLVNAFQACRDMNNHTETNFNNCGLPNSETNPLKRQIGQEIATRPETLFRAEDRSAQGEWAFHLAGNITLPNGTKVPVTRTPMNQARAAIVAQTVISYDLMNSLTQCNYTLPVWSSPKKSRNYRGDPELDVKVFNAVTGNNYTMAEYEKMGLRMYTLWRILTARYWSARQPELNPGADMRKHFDTAPAWAFDPKNEVSKPFTLERADWELGKDMVYDFFGYDKATGNPTEETLNDLGLGDTIAILKDEGIIA
jgi:aldehyde:ferredoxin oxidoreductase